MLKTLILSNVVGAFTALLGWVVAVMIKTAMTEATFESLRYGWAGLLAGSVSLFAIFMLGLLRDSIEPMIALLTAVGVSALAWNTRELPIAADGFQEQTPPWYWATFTTMALVFVLLFMGLRAARISTRRARA